jgi:hypothetical protein
MMQQKESVIVMDDGNNNNHNKNNQIFDCPFCTSISYKNKTILLTAIE